MSPRALLSVYDKTGLIELAQGLAGLGFELVASGGTARSLQAAGLPVTPVEQVTGFPEILGGRVKTLHPAVHGGILARRTPEHLAELADHGIVPVDLVVCNLYPFAATVARVPEVGGRPGVTEAVAVEEIDIGGVTLLRAAAKNFESVAVLCNPADYAGVLAALRDGGVGPEERRRLALAAFRHTAAYDAAIATWLAGRVEGGQADVGAGLASAQGGGQAQGGQAQGGQAQGGQAQGGQAQGGQAQGGQAQGGQAQGGQAQGLPLPGALNIAAERVQLLRYGENPHQQAALYRALAGSTGWDGDEPTFRQLQGKELSFNNIVDLEAAWDMAQDFDKPTVAIIKHTNPSGLASAEDLVEAYRLAFACDPVSAYGSIVAANRSVDLPLVEEVGSLFVEVLVAPGYTPEALAWLGRHKANCRVMVARGSDDDGIAPPLLLRSVRGGFLAQTPDLRGVDQAAWQIVTRRAPTEAERRSLAFAWQAVKHVKSNAIVFVQGTATVGVGAGQMNRVDSVYLAARRAGDRSRGAVMGSDAFFPFPDGIEAAAAAGVTACIQPGGSLRDEEAIAAADRLGLAMIFTGERHFRH